MPEMSEAAKEARRAYNRAYQEKNRERLREYQRKWKAEHRDKVNASQRKRAGEYEARKWEKKAAQMAAAQQALEDATP